MTTETQQPIHSFNSEGQVMTLAVANGFPVQTYTPLVRYFTANYRVLGMPPRALWHLYDAPPQSPPTAIKPWNKTLAVDLLNGLREHNLHDVIAVGHSFGGVATLVAVINDPTRFKAVILLDPTILPRFMLAGMWLNQKLGTDWNNILAQRAEKRRNTFESNEAAHEYFQGKRLFADWHPDAMRGYTDPMPPVDPSQSDGEVTLAWPRAWEAYYFRTIHTGVWGDLPRLRATGLPILLIRGGTSDTLTDDAAARIRKIMPDATYHEVDGHGHLFPQSAPDQTADIINEWLKRL